MKKMTVLFGPPQSGKTKAAKEMVEGKSVTYITCKNRRQIDNPHFFDSVNSLTEVIVFDDVPVKCLNYLMGTLFCDTIIVDQKGEPSFIIPCPEVIITTTATLSDLPTDLSTRRRFEYVECSLPHTDPIAPVIEGTIVNLPLQKLHAIKNLVIELRAAQVTIEGDKTSHGFYRSNLHNYFWSLMGFSEGILDRMLFESNDEPDWVNYVQSKIETYKAAYKIEIQ